MLLSNSGNFTAPKIALELLFYFSASYIRAVLNSSLPFEEAALKFYLPGDFEKITCPAENLPIPDERTRLFSPDFFYTRTDAPGSVLLTVYFPADAVSFPAL